MTVAKRVEIKLNPAGMRQLLRDPSVAGLERRARAVAARADSSLSAPGHSVEVHVGPNRARAIVKTTSTEARVAEARRRNLAFAVNAAGS